MHGAQALSAINTRPTAAVIADQLREGIINRAFGPGDQINEAQVATQLDVSRGPVREALHRLVQEGLLVGKPNRGVFVRDVTARDIEEIYEAREVIESATASMIITTLDDAERQGVADALVAVTERMQAAVDAGDWDRLRRLDLDFHTSLVAAGRNTRLDRAYATLATESLISMAQSETAYPRPERVVADHVDIAELLRGGDLQAVRRALHSHLSVEQPPPHVGQVEADASG